MKPAAGGRYDQIDALKGIAIFLVVLGHSVIYYPVNLHENAACEFLFQWLSSVHMQLFFVISGFCFSVPERYGAYVWKKVRRLMVPYVVFNAADILPRSLLPQLVNRPRGLGESLYKIVFDGGEYWFLYTLFIIFLIYPAIYKYLHRNVYTALALLILEAGLPYLPLPCSVFRVQSVAQYLFYFSLGAVIKQFFGGRVFQAEYGRTGVFPLIAALSIEWVLLLRMNASYMVMALTGLLVFYLCVQYRGVVEIFKPFGKYSLQLYLFNGYLLVVSRTIAVSIAGIRNPAVIIAFNMLIDFGLSYLIIKYVCERFRFVRVLMGMRA